MSTGPTSRRSWIAPGLALAAGVWLLFGPPLDLDDRFLRASPQGVKGLAFYLVGDYAGAARAYRADLRRSAQAGEEPAGDEALAALFSGDLAKAESLARAVLTRDPGSLPARLTIAEIALQRGAPRETLAVLGPALASPTEPFDALLLAAVAQARSGETGRAIDLLNLALSSSRVEERRTSFLQALEVTGELGRQSSATRPAALLATLHRYLRIFDETQGRVAIRRAKEAIARGDRAADAYLTIGIVHDKQGRPDDALDAMRHAIERYPSHAEALRWAALLYRRRGDLVNEYRMIRRAYEAAPADPRYVSHFGEVLVDRLGDLRQAKAVWERAVNDAPRNALALEQLGRVERFLGNHARAVELLEEALRLAPSRVMTRWHLGHALADAGRPDDAVQLFQQWVAGAPDDPAARTNLAMVYGRARRYREAIRELERSFQLGEQGPGYYEYLCELYFYETTDLRRAADCFRRLLAWQPDRPRALQLLPEIEKNLALAAVRGR